jgi:hypothetical protein
MIPIDGIGHPDFRCTVIVGSDAMAIRLAALSLAGTHRSESHLKEHKTALVNLQFVDSPAEALEDAATQADVVILEGMDKWLAHRVESGTDQQEILQSTADLCERALNDASPPTIVVFNNIEDDRALVAHQALGVLRSLCRVIEIEPDDDESSDQQEFIH